MVWKSAEEGQLIYWLKDAQNGAIRKEEHMRFIDMVKEDMQIVGVTEDDAEDRERWRMMICCGNS